jgi:glutathione S-transferase
VIVLRAKDVEFEVTYVDLSDKPDWFLKISPHGKVPVLVVDEVALFESNAIAEYLEETIEPRLHPEDPIQRARNRAWTDFASDFSDALYGLYWCESEADLPDKLKAAHARIEKLERAIAEERGNDGPLFNGTCISLVDAAYAPFLQRLAMIEEKAPLGSLDAFPLVKAWSDALVADERVAASVDPSFRDRFVGNLVKRECYPGSFFAEEAAE